MQSSIYLNSKTKRFIDVVLSLLFILITLPLMFLISLSIKLSSGGHILYMQKRAGKNGNVFRIFKFRTMVDGADRLQKKYLKFNETDGPVFKIKNDPRFTRIGKFLSRSGLDELPQFFNVLFSDMSIVGPRPLPLNEYKLLTKKQKIRNTVKPGITSTWVVNGSHSLKFKKWMELDRKYIKSATLYEDLNIILRTAKLILK